MASDKNSGSKLSISAIIPAYNEGEHIIDVIEAVKKTPNIHEIILVDDGSESCFKKLYKKIEGITLITNKINCGKTKAIEMGFKKSTGTHILILDADLSGLDAKALTEIQKYAKEKEVVQLVRGGDSNFFRIIGTTYLLAGEHLLKREFVENYYEELFGKPGWGFDNQINFIITRDKIDFCYCELSGVKHLRKYEKYSFRRGIYLDLISAASVLLFNYKVVHYPRLRLLLHQKIKNRVII
jgi:glycosyltransferase involved in cell wall biosynthesis